MGGEGARLVWTWLDRYKRWKCCGKYKELDSRLRDCVSIPTFALSIDVLLMQYCFRVGSSFLSYKSDEVQTNYSR
jgi:hypothetical protein